MTSWTKENPGAGDMGTVGNVAATLESTAESAQWVLDAGRNSVETLKDAWRSETSTAVRARFNHLLDGIEQIRAASETRGVALRAYIQDVIGVADSAAPQIKIREDALADIEELKPQIVAKRKEVNDPLRGLRPDPSTPVFPLKPEDAPPKCFPTPEKQLEDLEWRLADVESKRDKAIAILKDLGNDRRAADERLIEALDWVAPPRSPAGSGVYEPYYPSVRAGVAPPASVKEASSLGVKVANGTATVGEKYQYGTWVMMFSGDQAVTNSLLDTLRDGSVDPEDFIDSITGDDPASQAVRDGWTAAIGARSNDPEFAAAMMAFLGPQGLAYLYERIQLGGAPVLEPGSLVPVIPPGETSPDRGTQLNALGGAFATLFVTASQTTPGDFGGGTVEQSWAYGIEGQTAMGGMPDTAAAVSSYVNRGEEVGGKPIPLTAMAS